MSAFLATTLVTILRGGSTDEFGDEMDTASVAHRDVPASILEVSTRQSRQVEGRTDAVRGYKLRVHNNVTLLRDDRVQDQKTGNVYTVDQIVTPTNPVGHAIRSAALRRIT